MSYRYEQYEDRRRRSGGRCLLTGLVIIVMVVLAALLLARYVARPLLAQVFQRRLAQPLPEVTLPSSDPSITIPPGPQVIPISEADANQWVQDNRGQLQGIDDVVLHFVPGAITADITVGGFTATAQSGVELQDGRIRAVNPQLGPPLNLVVDIQPVVQLLETRLNNDLATLGRRITGLAVDQGQITITLE